MKKEILSIAFAISSSLVMAQFAIGTSTSYNLYFGDGVKNTIGIGLYSEHGLKGGKYTIRPSVNYFLPRTYSGSSFAYASNSLNSIHEIPIKYTDFLHIFSLGADVKRYFGKGNMKDGGLYCGAGVFLFTSITHPTYSSYDSQNYYIRRNLTNIYGFGLMPSGIVGYEKAFSFGSIYGEARITVPLKNSNNQNQYGFPNIPGSVAFQVGYKYLFGK